MKYQFVTACLLALIPRENSQCHAFLPASSSRTVGYSTNHQPKVTVRNSPNQNTLSEFGNNSTWDGGASQRESDAQLSSLSFYKLRRGGDDTKNRKKLANYLSAHSPYNALQSIKEGYNQRISADPEFLSKSIFEVIIAASTQFTAQVGRRGIHRILPEIDFVVPAILTAIFGKYFAMWTVARTQESNADEANEMENSVDDDASLTTNWRDKVPTNAFQPTLLDGHTTPTLSSRMLAFLLPMPQLFRGGVIASTVGYGFASFLIRIRTMYLPQYVVVTQPISVPLAAIFTGVFMAFVSNIRYQLLQGIVEPFMIDGTFVKLEALCNRRENSPDIKPKRIEYLGHLKKLVIIIVRYGNGLLGSWFSIVGMKACGLQNLKE